MSSGARVLAIFFAWIFLAAPLRAFTNDQVTLLDVDPQVTQPLGFDRASKYLLSSAKVGQQLSPSMALSIVAELMVLPEFQGGIGLALWEGDYRLARTMRQILLSLNMSQQATETLLAKMASSGGRLNPDVAQIMQTAATQEVCRKSLYDYMVQTPENYPVIVAGLSRFWSQPQLRITRLLRERFQQFLSGSEWDQVLAGDPTARWKLNELVEPELLRPNIFTDILRANAQESLQSPYFLFWSRWTAQVASEQPLLQEMINRLQQSTTVYDGLQACLAKSLSTTGDILMRQYLRASQIPQSRYQRIFQLLSGQTGHSVEMDSTPRSRMIGTWASQVSSDKVWCNYLLWHLTRPASSLARVTLHSIGEQLSGMQDLAQIAYNSIEDQNQPHPDWISQVVRDPREFQRLKAAGRLTASDWLSFGSGMARVLEQDPDAARWLLSDAPRSSLFFSKAMAAAMQSSSQMVMAWSGTMLHGDAMVQQRFLRFAIQNGAIRTAEEGQQWLNFIQAHATETVNPQVGKFKQIWGSWVQTGEGQSAVLMHLELEIWGVNQSVRQLLTNGWSENVDTYLTWRHMATFLPPDKGGILARDSIVLLRQGNFIQACLSGAQHGNLAIGDAMVPIWRAMFLRPESELVSAFQQELTRGALLGNPYSAGALALADAIEKVPGPVDQSIARVNLSGYSPGEAGRAKLIRSLLQAGSEVRPLVVDMMRNKEIWNTWRNSLFSAILYAGKGTAAADLVARSEALQKIWADELEKVFASDLNTVSYIMSGLAKQSAGNDGSADRLAAWRKELMNADAANQVFFEQMIADPSGGYRDQFDSLCAKYLSQ
ncbi:MAG: hypothetical protein PW734_01045 [Verrucomicrobium sp.]|nr:hypothetical protein [Verrucomicrobium sp.]